MSTSDSFPKGGDAKMPVIPPGATWPDNGTTAPLNADRVASGASIAPMSADETLQIAASLEDKELFSVGLQMKVAEQSIEISDLRARLTAAAADAKAAKEREAVLKDALMTAQGWAEEGTRSEEECALVRKALAAHPKQE